MKSIPRRQDAPASITERPAFLFAIIFCAIWVAHGPLLRLPYFWDEAGYFIPAARDFLLHGELIPKTTLSNAHPPLVMMWLAMWWKLSNYTAAVTRTAMLLVAAFGLLGVWKLGERVSNRKVAFAAVLLTAIYPVFFAQSSMAQLDVPVMALTMWALYFHISRRRVLTVVLFAIAGLVKETALIGPFTLLAWELVCPVIERAKQWSVCLHPHKFKHSLSFALTIVPLLGWYAYHYHVTGYIFGNPEYLRYNLGGTLSPLRIVIAFVMRIWHTFGYMNMFVLTAGALLVLREPVVIEDRKERAGIDLRVRIVFWLLILAQATAFAVVGGAALPRYILPTIPLVVILLVSSLYKHVRQWWAWVGLTAVAFVLALVFNPPWRIAPEDNLAYADFVRLHKDAAVWLEKNEPKATVLTAWPGSDELNRPFLGYVKQPMTVVRVENFTFPQMLAAAQQRDSYDSVFVFNTKYEPPRNLLARFGWWERIQKRFFDYHEDLRPEEIAILLRGRIVWQENRGGQWAAVIQVEHVENAKVQVLGARDQGLEKPGGAVDLAVGQSTND